MKILFVIAHLAKGGGQQTQSYRLIKELSKKNETRLITFKVRSYSGLVDEPCKTEYLGYLSFPYSILKLSKRLREIGKNYDSIQLLDPYFSLPGFYLSGLKKAYLRLGTNPIKDLQERGYNLGRIFYKFIFSSLLSKVKVIVNSKHLQAELIKYKPAYIPNGYDIKQFFVKETKKKLRKNLDLPLKERILIYTGKIIPRKRLEVVLEVLKKLDEKYYFVILGNKNEEHYGDKYYNKLKQDHYSIMHRVQFIDEVPMEKVKYYLNASDIFVFPSILEGSPNSVLEAMCCGLPVVCSDIKAHKNIIENGVNGYLFKDTNDLPLIIKKVDLKVGKIAKNYVDSKHNIKETANRYLEIYNGKI